METPGDIESWAVKTGLPAGISTVLLEDGFSTVDDLRHLTPDVIKQEFQDSGKLKLAQCLALKRAVAGLTQIPNPASASSPPDFSQHASSGSTTPQSSASQPLSYPHPPQSHPYPPQSHQTYPHQPYPYSPAPNPQPSPGGRAPYPTHPQMMSAQPQPYAHAAEGGIPGMAFGMGDATGHPECFRFLLLGKTGAGKSTTGNTIFGQKLFDTAACFSSVTGDCERRTNTTNGRKIEIIDSPGLYDTHRTQEETSVLIVQAVAGMHPGPHAILYVVRFGRYTAEEHGAYERLKALFDESISRYLIVVFTFGDMLEREQKSISDVLSSDKTPETLRQVLRECHNRYIVFNNMAANPQAQVEHLLQMVRGMVVKNGGQPYTCPRYSLVGQGMEEEVARRLHEVEKRDLQRQKYVQQLEQQTAEAENEARRTKEQYQKNEEARRRRMETEEKRRHQLEEQLQAQMREQQVKFEQQQQELQRMHKEREEQERMMKEKEAEMTEKQRKKAEEEAERMKQREQELRARMEKQEERLVRQMQEEEKRRQEMEREKQEFCRQMEEQRQKDREELRKKEEERKEMWERQREEEREAARRREENYEKEMEDLKNQITSTQKINFAEIASNVVEIVRFFVTIMREDNSSEASTAERHNPLSGRSRTPSMD